MNRQASKNNKQIFHSLFSYYKSYSIPLQLVQYKMLLVIPYILFSTFALGKLHQKIIMTIGAVLIWEGYSNYAGTTLGTMQGIMNYYSSSFANKY